MIEELRYEIDQIDIQLVELLAKRQRVTTRVGAYKKEVGKPIYDPERETELIGNRQQLANKLGVSAELVEDLLRRIMRESYRSQHKEYQCVKPGTKVVVVGGHGALGRRFVDMFMRSGYEVQVFEREDWPISESRLADAGLVVISVPITKTQEIIKGLPTLPADCVLVDVTSLKSGPLSAMMATHSGPVLGLHPMFGPDVPNFVKQVVVACHGRRAKEYDWLLKQIEIWGAMIQVDKADNHDESMQLVQAMRHFTTYVYGRFLSQQNADLDRLLRLSSPIYRLELAMTGRLFAQDPHLYADIIYEAKDAKMLSDDFMQVLNDAIEDLKAGDKQSFEFKFNQVADWFGDRSAMFLKDSRAMLQTAQDARSVDTPA